MLSDNAASPSYSFEMTLDLGEQNHRKRRRNRMRVSCLNCHASKRKCDRKRPCTRCIKHGLTGLCVYELDDPASRDGGQLDENARLRQRIAELESVIRELNNRPHPRWLAPGGTTHNPDFVGARRGPRRRGKADCVRSASVDAFFGAIADAEGEIRVKVEQEGFVPEFTPSEVAVPAGLSCSPLDSPLTPLSPLSRDSPVSISSPLTIFSTSSSAPPSNLRSPSSRSAPFSFGDEPYTDASEPPPLLFNFIQGKRVGAAIRASSYSKSPTEGLSPAGSDSSEEGPPLALLFPCRSEAVESTFFLEYSAPSQPLPPEERFRRLSVGIQTSPDPSPPPPAPPPISPSVEANNDDAKCRCLTDATVYNPLVFFASALRTSREALESLHPSASNCVLFRRILELDEHIFSASPPTPSASPKLPPVRDLGVHCTQEPTLAPSSPPTNPFGSPIRHPHSYSLPFYSQPPSAFPSVHQPSETSQHIFESDAFAYLPDSSGYPQLRGWL